MEDVAKSAIAKEESAGRCPRAVHKSAQSSLAAPFLEEAIAAVRLGCLRLVLAPEENGGTEWPDRSPRQMVVPSRSAPELIRVGVGM